MTHSISVSSETYNLLRRRAKQARVSPDALADDALRQHFTRDEPAWEQAFASLLERVQTRTKDFASAEIEADITAAAEEAKELRRARRGAG